MRIYFRHERMRPYQERLIGDIYSAITHNSMILICAPTGCGKTDSALSAAVTHAVKKNLNVLFLTPKISQHKLAVEVILELRKKYSLPIRVVDVVGRYNACADDTLSSLDVESFYQICELRRKNFSCKYKNNISDDKLEEFFSYFGDGKNAFDLIKSGRERGLCPYELMLRACSFSNMIVGDYYHFFIPSIRENLFSKVKRDIKDFIVIVDEAHNLAPRIRDYLSFSVGSPLLKRVEREFESCGYPVPDLRSRFDEWARSILGKADEKKVDKESLHHFLNYFDIDFFSSLEDVGLLCIKKKNKKSASIKLARFISEWDSDYECVRILKAERKRFFLVKKILDPSPLTSVLNSCHSAILMSASLVPLEMHRDVLGLDKNRTLMRSYPSPFNPDGILHVIFPGVTTQFVERNKRNYSLIAGKIDSVVKASPGGVAVFFPSYAVLDGVLPFLKSNAVAQRQGMKSDQIRRLIDDFKKGAVLCGVQGGSLSEGIDFSKGEIKTIIIVGIALDELNIERKALISYYQKKFKKGWEYGYLYPGVARALQAAGRGRRKDGDRVVVVYMDGRFVWKRYNWIFNKEEPIIVTTEPEGCISSFWNRS